MARMFQIGNYVLRETERTLNRNTNTASFKLIYEPLLETPVLYNYNLTKNFFIQITDVHTWDNIKNSGTDPLINMIGIETMRYRNVLENYIDDGITPVPYPEKFSEIVLFLADKDFTIIERE